MVQVEMDLPTWQKLQAMLMDTHGFEMHDGESCTLFNNMYEMSMTAKLKEEDQ